MRGRSNLPDLPAWLPQVYLDALTSSDVELEPDLIFFGALRARRENAEYADPDYWVGGERADRWWVFGGSGQGDHWLLNAEYQVYFFDHDQGQRSFARFAFIVESLTQWFEIASALNTPASDDQAGRHATRSALERISPDLPSRYPFSLV